MKADLKRSHFLLSALLCGMAVTAAATNAQAQEFHRWAESARGLGMGGALTAVATGSDAMLYNPAGLIQQQFWKVELSGSTDKSDSDPDGFFSTFNGFPGTAEEVDAFLVESEESRYLREQLFASFHNGRGLGFGFIAITPPQPPRFEEEPPQPLQAMIEHPRRGPVNPAAQELEGSSNSHDNRDI